ncbi:MAG: FapA family protein [Eubacteriales bacterium]|nr:FapA family protein [Eubacteriales bacterium]
MEAEDRKSNGSRFEEGNVLEAGYVRFSQLLFDPKDVEQAPNAPGNAFLLTYNPDGVFLTLKLATPLSEAEQRALLTHLSRKRIYTMDTTVIAGNLFDKRGQLIRIAPEQREFVYDEAFNVTIEDNQMTAYMTLSSPEPNKGRQLTFQRVMQDIQGLYHIGYGLKKEVVAEALENHQYDQRILIAEGLYPVTGADGQLIYHFEKRYKNSEYRAHTLDEADESKVDFKELDLFESVTKDQLLVTKVPPKAGTPGCTVLGIMIPGEMGMLYNLPTGKNTYVSEDKLKLYSMMNGRVYIVKDKVEVSNTYTVDGNVDLSVGNIVFDGDVVVRGTVENGYTVKATGSIEVTGTVEAATLEAGTDVLAYGGIQGASKGTIRAGGSVYARFMEYANIYADEMVVSESILNCNVSCGGTVEALTGRGTIIGGNMTACRYIATRFIGTQGGCKTYLEVGVPAGTKEKVTALKSQIEKLTKIIDGLQSIVQRPIAANQPEEVKQERIEMIKKLLAANESKEQKEAEFEKIKAQVDSAKEGMVHVLMKVYPGATIAIGNLRFGVRSEISYATFRALEKEIEFTSCRFKQKPARMPRLKR